MGISEGKVALYTVGAGAARCHHAYKAAGLYISRHLMCPPQPVVQFGTCKLITRTLITHHLHTHSLTHVAGVDPSKCLPICVDVGTNNQALLDDPQYKGLRRRRVARAEFDAFMQEVMGALAAWQPHVLVQFEVRPAKSTCICYCSQRLHIQFMPAVDCCSSAAPSLLHPSASIRG